MANKNDLFDFDESTASNNDNVLGANIAENCAPSGINNAIRGLAAIVKRALGSQGSAIASAATTAIGAAGTALYTTVTGTTPITSFGTVGAGTFRIIEFTNALTLTHNATSLKLPGSANIVTANGDVGFFVSLGSGNWKCLGYLKADGTPIVSSITSAAAGTLLTLTSTDAGAGVGPDIDLFRNSASPANADVLGAVNFKGKDSAAGTNIYARIVADIADPTATSEDGTLTFQVAQAGSLVSVLSLRLGAFIGVPTGTDKGVGTLNATGLYVNGHGTIAQVVRNTEATYTTLGTILPADNSIPQNTEGDEVLSVEITPTNAGSILRIRVNLNVGGATGAQLCAALFVDNTASALKAASTAIQSSGIMGQITFEHAVPASSTALRTYKVRVGAAGATDGYLNGDISSRVFGGVAISTIEVEEILPQ